MTKTMIISSKNTFLMKCWEEKTTESKKVQAGGIASPRKGQIHVKATYRRLNSILNFKVQGKKI